MYVFIYMYLFICIYIYICIYICVYIYIVMANSLKSKTGLYFRTCEDRAGWHLIPCRISPRSEFFSRAHKNWHIM